MRTGAVGGDYAGLGNRRGSIEERLDLGSVRLVESVEWVGADRVDALDVRSTWKG